MMKNTMKKVLSFLLAIALIAGMVVSTPISAFATGSESITGTITEDTVWNDGDVISGVTIAGDVTITVNGTVTVAGTIRMGTDSIHTVTIKGGTADAKLIRGNGFTGQMFYVEGNSYVFHNLNFQGLTLDGGAIWTGDEDSALGRGTVNEGVKATGSVLYLVRANATLDNCVLQNHDDASMEKSNAVFLREYATITFNKSIARNNSSFAGYWKGGVVSTRYGGTVIAKDSEVYGNSASHGGFVGVGASGSYGTKVECDNTKIHHNYASTCGAAFYLQDNGATIYQTLGDRGPAYLKLNGCTLENNSSPDGLIHSYVYYAPAWIVDTTIANNNCAIYTYGSGENRSFSVAGNTQITTDYEGILYEAPVRIYGQLVGTASIPMNKAAVDYLMGKYGYLATATPDIDHQYNHTEKKQSSVVPYEYTGHALYNVTLADLAQLKLYEGNGYTGWVLTDVDGNGMLDAVPVNVESTTVDVTLIDTFKNGSASESQSVSNVVENVPVCYYEHTGYFFNGWLTENGTLIKDASSNVILNGGEKLTATWAVARPRITISASANKAMEGQSITLTATINNQDTTHLNYTYQWYKNSTAIEGATDSTYTVTEAEAGYYSYQCKIVATDSQYTSETEHATKTVYGTNSNVESIVLQFKAAPPVAKIVETGVEYKTLSEAVAAANELGTATIEMLADVDFDSDAALSITGNVTIIGKHTISRGDYTGTLFTVPAGSTLTLDGGLVIDGNNNWSYKDGAPVLKPGGDTYLSDHVNSEEGAPNATGYMIENFGTLNVNKVTIQNSYSTNDCGVIKARTESNTTINGATIQHIASSNCGAVVQIGRNNVTSNFATLTIKGDTRITGNIGAYNGGIIVLHSHGNTFNFEGGSIDNNYIVAAGTVIMSYSHWDNMEARNTVNMSGGIITKNEAEGFGPMYIHTRSIFNMSGGEISENISYYPNYARNNNSGTITGGVIVDNKLYIDYAYTDLRLPAEVVPITGGIYTQNVSQWCAAGYVCIPYDQDISAYCDLSYAPEGYDHNTRNNDYIVVPGYKISYYFVETNDTETTETLVHEDFLLIPAGKKHDEVDLFATPYYYLNGDQSQAIKTWYTTNAMDTEYDYATEVTANLKLYGATWEDMIYVAEIVETGAKYETLTEAVADANALGTATIKLLKDIDFDSDSALTINGNITITGEHTISRGDYTGTLFIVPADSTLTLDGGIVFDGSNNWAFDEDAYNEALKDETIAQTVSSFVTSEENGTIATAPMFVVNGSVVANNTTLQNNFSTGSSNNGQYAIFQVNSNATLTMDGATVTHVATGGANAVAHLASNAEWHIKGETVISDNFSGRNGGLCRNDGGQIYMYSGTIKDNHAVNASGHVFMMYSSGALFEMFGGTICNNSSLPGVDNEVRTAAIYLHSNSKMVMHDGTICHNSGSQCGGIVSKKNAGSSLIIENGFFEDNVSVFGDETHDIQTNGNSAAISGGIYTQDVDDLCAPGYVCIPYDETERTDDYIVVPGFRVSYYAVSTDAETGETVITLVHKELLTIPADKTYDQVDLFANNKDTYTMIDTENGLAILGWYTDVEMTSSYDFGTEVVENINLYGEWEGIASLTVNHVDSNGNVLAEQEVSILPVGSQYTTDAKEFEGYILTATPDNASGTMTSEGMTVTYTYALITYTIKYNAGEGQYVGSEPNRGDNWMLIKNGYTYNVPVTLHDGEGFQRDGYELVGWTINGVDYELGETVEKNFTHVQSGTVQAYAIWAESSDDETGSDIEIDDEDSPSAETPDTDTDTDTEIDEEEPPKAETPNTGDFGMIWVLFTVIAAAALFALVLNKRKMA